MKDKQPFILLSKGLHPMDKQWKEEGDEIDLFFSGFDRNLNQAALKEGLQIQHEIR